MNTNEQVIAAADAAVTSLQDLRTTLITLIDGLQAPADIEKARVMLADTELALSTLAGRHRNDHTFQAKRIAGEGYQAGCKCTWTGGMVERTIGQAEQVWDRYHVQQLGQ